MSVACLFTCNGCGATGMGSIGDYQCPDPPLGWIWWFGGGMRAEGPHACSVACWNKIQHSPEGKLYLPDSHERREVRVERCSEVAVRPVESIASRTARPTWVYFAQRGADGPIKIGVSGSVKTRVSALQTAVAEPVHLLASIVGDRHIEAALHERFRSSRLKGEWFSPSSELLAHIASLKSAC